MIVLNGILYNLAFDNNYVKFNHLLKQLNYTKITFINKKKG